MLLAVKKKALVSFTFFQHSASGKRAAGASAESRSSAR